MGETRPADSGESLQGRLGRQNAWRWFSDFLFAALRRVADVENDRFGTFGDSVRVRTVQARRRDPNRRRAVSWVLLFACGSSNSFMGVGGVT